jgi:hypothetical protein
MADDVTLYRTEARVNAIYVIESLPPGDLKTGRDLYDEVIFPATRSLDGMHTEFQSVKSEDELARALAVVARAVHLSGRKPIVHFETHGSEDGITLADGTDVPWSRLVPLLGDINRASRMNLVVVGFLHGMESYPSVDAC